MQGQAQIQTTLAQSAEVFRQKNARKTPRLITQPFVRIMHMARVPVVDGDTLICTAIELWRGIRPFEVTAAGGGGTGLAGPESRAQSCTGFSKALGKKMALSALADWLALDLPTEYAKINNGVVYKSRAGSGAHRPACAKSFQQPRQIDVELL